MHNMSGAFLARVNQVISDSPRAQGNVPMVRLPTREALAFASAVALIGDGVRWTSGTPFRDEYNRSTDEHHAAYFCAQGAMHFSGMTDAQREDFNRWSANRYGRLIEVINDLQGHRSVMQAMRGYAHHRGWPLAA